MSIFISSTNVPIGYTTPKFPSLFWPVGANRSSYLNSFLYSSWDVWRFTIFWSLLLSGVLYLLVGILASSSSLVNKIRHNLRIKTHDLLLSVLVIVFYTLVGLIKGFIGGAIIGLILAAIYQAGSLTMSTWLPLTWAIAQILYDIASSYSTSSIIL
ncbi:unnamed protein product [Candida verbasci]|uniref:Uncharacterized protein n=1 Tax=Candida verbasci TaxID=1227364 RepID=A0A9W4TYH3_9ASCO|nr:unnamed protein product [Candida verbasci]